MNALKGLGIALLLIGAWGLVGTLELEDEIKEEQHYCEMRKIWEESKQIDSQFRPGWPNFKPEVKCP
jgi:hypothetical protein